MGYKVCSDGAEIELPTNGQATLDQCREQGAVCGREYFRWWTEMQGKPDCPSEIHSPHHMHGYLQVFHEKMAPVFALSDDQVLAFNNAALEECGRLLEQFAVGMELFNKCLEAGLGLLNAVVPRHQLMTSTAISDNVVPFERGNTKH